MECIIASSGKCTFKTADIFASEIPIV